MIFSRVGFDDLTVEPHVGNCHSVLGQRSSLVGADGRGGSQCFDGFQVFDQAVLAGHSFGRQCQADGDGGQKTFGHVGHDDTDQEDDSVQPLVAKGQGDDEESHTEKDGNASNQVDEMGNFAGDRSFAGVQTGSQSSNSTHDSIVTDLDDDRSGRSYIINCQTVTKWISDLFDVCKLRKA